MKKSIQWPRRRNRRSVEERGVPHNAEPVRIKNRLADTGCEENTERNEQQKSGGRSQNEDRRGKRTRSLALKKKKNARLAAANTRTRAAASPLRSESARLREYAVKDRRNVQWTMVKRHVIFANA